MTASNDLICEAGREYRTNRRTRDSAHGRLRANLKKFGEQGVNLKSLVRIANLMGKQEPEEVVRQLADDLHYARLMMQTELTLETRDTQVSNSTKLANDIMT